MLEHVTALLLLILLLQGISALPRSIDEVDEDPENDKRIIQGNDATPGQFPFMATMTHKAIISGINQTTKFCGGAILAEKWILTAAHCTKELYAPPEYFGEKWAKSVVVGTNNIWEFNQYRQMVPIKKPFEHPKYRGGKQPHDLALVCLERPLKWNPYVQPIKFYQPDDLPAQKAIAAGWGAINRTHEWIQARDLQYIDPQPIVPHGECVKIYKRSENYPSLVTDHHICLQSVNGTGPCAGDSGSPLFINKDGEWRILGVASFNYKPGTCGEYPTVYAIVEPDWITETMKNNPC